jgi:hypothetical protein
MKQLLLILLIGFCSLSSCTHDKNGPLVGVWQGINDQGNDIRIEFSPDGYYLLFVDGRSLTTSIAESGQVRYEILQDTPSFQVALFGENDRIYFGKLSATFPAENQMTLHQLFAEGKPEPKDAILLSKSH